MNTHKEKCLGSLCATLLLAGALSLAGCSNEPTRPMDKEPAYGGGSTVTVPDSVGALKDRWGVEVLGIHTTATGYMLDFRYRVLDAEKAAPLLDRRIKQKPYVIVEKDNAKLGVPVTSKLGALRQTTFNVKANRNYFVLFSNPARHVHSGDKVTVVIGDFKVKHLTVL
jgi:hypothetical protein